VSPAEVAAEKTIRLTASRACSRTRGGRPAIPPGLRVTAVLLMISTPRWLLVLALTVWLD
jgi:hypothetical protein